MTPTQNRFLSILDLAERKLLAGEYGSHLNELVAELQRLVEEDVAVASLLADGEAEPAERFDAVVQAGKELRDERQGRNVRCRACPGAMHTDGNCPFRWAPETR